MKFGYNPNSSSLAMDVSLLLLGATALAVLSVFVSSALRVALRRPPRDAGTSGQDAPGARDGAS